MPEARGPGVSGVAVESRVGGVHTNWLFRRQPGAGAKVGGFALSSVRREGKARSFGRGPPTEHAVCGAPDANRRVRLARALDGRVHRRLRSPRGDARPDWRIRSHAVSRRFGVRLAVGGTGSGIVRRSSKRSRWSAGRHCGRRVDHHGGWPRGVGCSLTALSLTTVDALHGCVAVGFRRTGSGVPTGAPGFGVVPAETLRAEWLPR